METAAAAGDAGGGFMEGLEPELGGVEGVLGTCRRKGGCSGW